MFCKKFYFFSFIFIVILSTFTYGVGIGQYNRERQILFESGMEKTYGFQLSDSLKIDTSVEGDLARYAVINDPLPGGPPRNIEVTLKLPEFLDPGVHILYVVASERPDTEASIGGISSVRVGMEVFALYPGKHPYINNVLAKDININDTSTIQLIMINQGEETIEQAYAEFAVYDQDGKFITSLRSDSKSVAPYETQTLMAVLDTSSLDLKPGTFKVTGNLTYDNTLYPESRESTFIIGEMKVDIIAYTPELFANSTNKFVMTLESDWAGDINDVFGRISLPNGKVIKTPNADLSKPGPGIKASAVLETYIETDGMPLGTNELSIDINYADKVTNQKINVNIVDGKPPEVEKPRIITPMLIFIALSVIIILFVAVYFLVFRKGGSGREPSHKQDHGSVQDSNIDIKPPSL